MIVVAEEVLTHSRAVITYLNAVCVFKKCFHVHTSIIKAKNVCTFVTSHLFWVRIEHLTTGLAVKLTNY